MRRLDELDWSELLNVILNNFDAGLSTCCYCVMCEARPKVTVALGYICTNCGETKGV
jgi:hypothetical protein